MKADKEKMKEDTKHLKADDSKMKKDAKMKEEKPAKK